MFDSFASAGYCGSSVALPDGGQLNLPTPGCKMLSMCCEETTFPEGTQSTCNSIAAANDDARCVSAYDSYSDALCYCDCTP